MTIREKPHRLPREAYRGHITVAFTCCSANRQHVFDRPERVDPLKDLLLARAAANYCDVVLYCFMPDHLHVILHGTADEADVWRAITDFKQRSGYWLQQHKELYAGATWQKDFYDHTIRTREDLGAQVRYSANNPVRKDLVKNWDEYQFTGPSGADLRALIDSAMTL